MRTITCDRCKKIDSSMKIERYTIFIKPVICKADEQHKLGASIFVDNDPDLCLVCAKHLIEAIRDIIGPPDSR